MTNYSLFFNLVLILFCILATPNLPHSDISHLTLLQTKIAPQINWYIIYYPRLQSTKMANDQEMKLKNERHHSSSLSRKGNKAGSQQDKAQMGPIMLGVFLFVVVGSALFQIFNVANRSSSDILI